MIKEKDSKNKLNIFKVYVELLPTAYKTYPFLFLLSQLLGVLHGLSWGITTMITQRFFDSAAQVAQSQADISIAILSLASLGGIYFANQLLNGVGNFVPQVYADKAMGRLQEKINLKIGRISPILFEDTNILDDINKANEGKNHAIWFVLTFSIAFTFYIPYFGFMAWYLFTLKPILALSIVIIFIPTLLTQIIRTKVFAKLEDKSAPIRRKYDYYESCMVGREYFKETRILGAFSFFLELYRSSLLLLNKMSWKAGFKTSIYEFVMKLFTLAGYMGILYMLFTALMKGEISVGAFAAVFASIGALFAIMEELVCRHFGSIAQNLGTIQNYIRFLAIPERGNDNLIDLPSSDISLDNVSFSYPLADNTAVKNASITIKNGETIAIVGENGSGKSTMIRLITGLYLPDDGNVLYGSYNTRNIPVQSLFKNISGVFQKYQRYQLTLRENISISDVAIAADDEYLDDVAGMSGLDTKDRSLNNGYDTMLSREFDGVDLSGGQWQRVAIARGFYRPHSIIVLDEPTAAIDPLEETRVYKRFAEISKDKTAIIVTHRLGSVKLADRIIVMDKGEIVDMGTHSQLIEKSSKYKEMWNAQAQYYTE